MGLIEIPTEYRVEAKRLVAEASATVPLACGALQEEVTNVIAAILHMRPAPLSLSTPEELAKRCIGRANDCFRKNQQEVGGERPDLVELTRDDFRSHTFQEEFA